MGIGRIRTASQACMLLAAFALPASSQRRGDLSSVSLDSLLRVKISAAARYDQTTAEAPSSVTIVTASDIRRLGYRSLDQVLAAVRGFYTASDRDYDYVGVRGFGRPTDYNNRLLLMLNGHPLNEGFYGFAPVGPDLGVALEALERIEIVRGPGSSLFGPNAMFAVVNLVTRSGRSLDAIGLHQDVGSYGARRTWGIVGGTLGDVASYHISGEAASSAGETLYFPEYDSATNNGVARGVDGERHRNLFTQVQLGELALQAHATYREKVIPTGAWGTIFGDPRSRTRDEFELAELSWEHHLDDAHRVSLHASVDRYRYRGFYQEDPISQRDGNDVRRAMLEGRLLWDLRPTNRLELGAELRDHGRAHYFEYDDSVVYFDGDYPYRTWSVFAQDEQHFTSALGLVLGLRYDHNSMTADRATPRAALLLTPGRATVVKLLYGEAFRGPSVYERYYHDHDFAQATGLRPEIVATTELTVEQHLTRTAWVTFSAFRSRVRNLIDTIELEDGRAQFVNRQRATTSGLEGELLARSEAGHMARFSYTYSAARDPDTGAPLTNNPRHVARLAGLVSLPHSLSAGTEWRYESSRLTVQDTRTSPFLVGDVNFLADRVVAGLGASLRLSNVLNRYYQVPGGYEHRQAAIVQPRRQVVLSVGYTLEGRAR